MLSFIFLLIYFDFGGLWNFHRKDALTSKTPNLTPFAQLLVTDSIDVA
jgi:hypothetical protein